MRMKNKTEGKITEIAKEVQEAKRKKQVEDKTKAKAKRAEVNINVEEEGNDESSGDEGGEPKKKRKKEQGVGQEKARKDRKAAAKEMKDTVRGGNQVEFQDMTNWCGM